MNEGYGWHTAIGAEIPHVAVFWVDEDGDETRIADIYIQEDCVGEAENIAIDLVAMLNRTERRS